MTDVRKNGISGITVTISTDPPAQATTDASGNYAFTNIPAGAYIITPSNDQRDRFSPSMKEVSVTSKDLTGVDFKFRGGRGRR